MVGLESEREARINEVVRRPLKWDFLLRTARLHGMLPLLDHHLRSVPPEWVPESAARLLLDHHKSNTWRSILLSRSLIQVLKLLEEAGIQAIPIKGPLLAFSLYGDLTRRALSDLDLLVQPHQMQQVQSLLSASGYRLRKDESPLPNRFHESFFDQEGFRIEVHWSLLEPDLRTGLGPLNFWDRLVRRRFLGTTLQTLSNEDHLIMVAIHGRRYNWYGIRWICDAARLASRVELDWSRVFRPVVGSATKESILLALFLSHNLLGASLPPEVQRKIRTTARIQSLGLQVAKLLACDSDSISRDVRSLVMDCQKRSSLPRRASLLITRITKPKAVDLQAVRLPYALFPLYVPIRLLRLLLKYTGAARSSPVENLNSESSEQ